MSKENLIPIGNYVRKKGEADYYIVKSYVGIYDLIIPNKETPVLFKGLVPRDIIKLYLSFEIFKKNIRIELDENDFICDCDELGSENIPNEYKCEIFYKNNIPIKCAFKRVGTKVIIKKFDISKAFFDKKTLNLINSFFLYEDFKSNEETTVSIDDLENTNMNIFDKDFTEYISNKVYKSRCKKLFVNKLRFLPIIRHFTYNNLLKTHAKFAVDTISDRYKYVFEVEDGIMQLF